MTSGLNTQSQVVWIHKFPFFSHSGVNWKVILRFDVYTAIDAGLESSKVYVPRLVKTKIESFP